MDLEISAQISLDDGFERKFCMRSLATFSFLGIALACLCAPAAKADTTALPASGFGDFLFIPPSSPGGTGAFVVSSILQASSVAPPGGWEWGWTIGTVALTADNRYTFPAGGGPVTTPAGLSSFFELTGAIQGEGDQVFLAGFITWNEVEPIAGTEAEITGAVDFSTIEGGSPGSPISISNISNFGLLSFLVSCTPDSCLNVDPVGTVSAVTLEYSYKGGSTAVPEPASWWVAAAGLILTTFLAKEPEGLK
jgi:hypothetical protein